LQATNHAHSKSSTDEIICTSLAGFSQYNRAVEQEQASKPHAHKACPSSWKLWNVQTTDHDIKTMNLSPKKLYALRQKEKMGADLMVQPSQQ
jgi:hypothetical protein